MNIYNNRYFNFLLRREQETNRTEFERKGASIVDETKFTRYCTSNSKATYWTTFIILGIVLFQITKFIIGRFG